MDTSIPPKIKILIFFFLIAGCKAVENNPKPEQTPLPVEEVADTSIDEDSAKVTLGPFVNYRKSRSREFDLIHTKLEVSFDWNKQHLLGTATLELSPYFYPQDHLTLDAKGFDLHNIALVNGMEKKNLENEYNGLKITIELDREYKKGEHLFLEIQYTAKPNELKTSGGEAITSDKGLFFINPNGVDKTKPQQIWTQGETESSSCWFPTIDAPNERSTQEIFITVRKEYLTLSNGSLIYSLINEDDTRTDYWKLDQPHAPYLFMMAIGNFKVVQDTWKDLEVNYYVEPEYEEHARAIFGATPEMMSFFSEKLNYDFPWPKYSQIVVRDYVSGAMENTTASVFMEDLQVNNRELLDYNWEDIIAHELIHQWFGNLVTCESWSNLPLNEAFANYGEYLWYEHKYGEEEADYHGYLEQLEYLEESEDEQKDLIRFYYDNRDDMFDSHSYSKGGRVLHMLRKYVGDDAFFTALNHYLKENEYKSVEIHDLRLAFEEITGEDLNWFFSQWFLSSGHPQLEVQHEYDSGMLKMKVWQHQDIEKYPVYKLPLFVDILIKDEIKRYPIVIENSYEQFEFELEEEPRFVLFDGDQQLLGEIEHEKSFEESLYQYYNSDQLLARYRALDNLAIDATYDSLTFYDEVIEVYIDALSDNHWAIRELALEALEDYEGTQLRNAEEKIEHLAKHDQKALVRAAAINTLSSFDINQYKDLFKESMKDSSYSVAGSALYAYVQSDATDKDEIVESFAQEQNINIAVAVAEHFLSENLYHKHDWFETRLQSAKKEDLFYLLQYYGGFIIDAPTDTQEKGIKILRELAISNEEDYIRLAAFQALHLLPETEELLQIKKEIKQLETDQEIKEYYDSLD
ncbi:M1 family aminopeptidase [Fulvivirgaceae bacterium BMA10]|uniref:Aminopeptidase N n=1 Tax=Splendidivirga corallicola TaxID=3051826 RepID=A0ABT8L025_9BACT|nr:M1 family aminopeptidase [Fulvivirgaceae bacterium BMA10]